MSTAHLRPQSYPELQLQRRGRADRTPLPGNPGHLWERPPTEDLNSGFRSPTTIQVPDEKVHSKVELIQVGLFQSLLLMTGVMLLPTL